MLSFEAMSAVPNHGGDALGQVCHEAPLRLARRASAAREPQANGAGRDTERHGDVMFLRPTQLGEELQPESLVSLVHHPRPARVQRSLPSAIQLTLVRRIRQT